LTDNHSRETVAGYISADAWKLLGIQPIDDKLATDHGLPNQEFDGRRRR
jgi:hypothetical protein